MSQSPLDPAREFIEHEGRRCLVIPVTSVRVEVEGAPRAGTVVVLSSGPGGTYRAETDGEGHGELTDVVPGKYRAHAARRGRGAGRAKVVIVPAMPNAFLRFGPED